MAHPDLTRIEALLEQIVALLSNDVTRRAEPSPDDAMMVKLLAAIASQRGSEPWRVSWLRDQHPALTLILGTRTDKSVGKMLSRYEGRPLDGHVLRRVAGLWSVLVTTV